MPEILACNDGRDVLIVSMKVLDCWRSSGAGVLYAVMTSLISTFQKFHKSFRRNYFRLPSNLMEH